MIRKKQFFYPVACSVFVYMLLLISSCAQDERKPDVSAVDLKLKVNRFEQDLFAIDPSNVSSSVAALKERYGRFFDLFAFQVTTLGHPDSAVMDQRFYEFVSDTNFRTIFTDCQQRFGDFSRFESGINEGFKYYHYYFPKKQIPSIVTLISAFSYPVICDSTHLGISLDMYLGPEYKYYGTLEPPLPNYLRQRMREEYLVSDAMKGWIMSDYVSDEAGGNLLQKMVEQGRVIYLLDQLLPDTEDTLKTVYSSKQLAWCYANEKKIWSFFIDNKLLFSTDPVVISKYVGEGPTTNGFPAESPGNIGQFIGWQIVKSYMKNNPKVTVPELMNDVDLQAIFNASKYKPAK